MGDDVVIVLDCGATKLSATVINDNGEMLKTASCQNGPLPQPGGEASWRIWDIDNICHKLFDLCRQVSGSVNRDRIKAVTVCTFGIDGAPVRKDGKLTYPVISWYDARTRPLVNEIKEAMDPWDIFAETGYQLFAFNTLLRLIWLRRFAAKTLDSAKYWLMMPGLITFRLCGEFSMEPTDAGTMMAMKQNKRDWSEKMLELSDLDSSFFPEWSEPGEVIGYVHSKASKHTGLPTGTPVIASGHDTQFAAIGSGASSDEAILSSGTWEILMLRDNKFKPSRFGFREGTVIENDAIPGFWNPQMLMMGSGVIEWLRRHFYGEIPELGKAYSRMMADGKKTKLGAGGLIVLPCFVAGTGPTKRYNTSGTILGLTINTERCQIYRAVLEGLSFQLKHALNILTRATGSKVRGIRVVGGGSKNRLWNQIRADVTGLPITTIAQKDATSLGAALFAFVGAGTYSNVDEARANVAFKRLVLQPTERTADYEDLFVKYMEVPRRLSKFYNSFR